MKRVHKINIHTQQFTSDGLPNDAMAMPESPQPTIITFTFSGEQQASVQHDEYQHHEQVHLQLSPECTICMQPFVGFQGQVLVPVPEHFFMLLSSFIFLHTFLPLIHGLEKVMDDLS